MNNLTTAERINKMITDTYGHREVTIDTKLENDLGIDSLDIVELCMDIEIEFDIEFNEEYDNQWGAVETVQDIIDLTEKVMGSIVKSK